MPITLISIAAIVLALISIYCYYKKSKLFGLFKPLTTSFIIFLGYAVMSNSPTLYSKVIFVSLFFALIGDVLLIGYKHLLPGLLFFVLVHIGLIIGITSFYGFQLLPYPLLPLAVFGFGFFFYMKKSLGRFKIPLAIYIVVIIVMNWQAINLLLINGNTSSWLIAIASLLFAFSDSVIAFNLFKKQFRASELLILSTYWMSIYMLTIAGYLM